MLDHFFSKYALYFTTQVCDYHLLFWLTGTNWPSQSFEQSPAVLRREFAAGSSDWRTFGNTETGEPVSLQIFEIIFNFKESSWNSKMLEVDFDHICWPTENIVKILENLANPRKGLPLNLRGIEKRFFLFKVVFLFFLLFF